METARTEAMEKFGEIVADTDVTAVLAGTDNFDKIQRATYMLTDYIWNYLEKRQSAFTDNSEERLSWKIIDILVHHLNSLCCLLGAWITLMNKGKRDDDKILNLRYETMLHDFKSAVVFIFAFLADEHPGTINIYTDRMYTDYIAVETDEGPSLKRLLKKADIPETIAKLEEIIADGGGRLYREMLDELKSGEYGNRFFIKE